MGYGDGGRLISDGIKKSDRANPMLVRYVVIKRRVECLETFLLDLSDSDFHLRIVGQIHERQGALLTETA